MTITPTPSAAVALTPLALDQHFPPVSPGAWVKKIRSDGYDLRDLRWQSRDAFDAAPLYTAADVPSALPPLWTHDMWHICTDVPCSGGNAALLAALRSGAGALRLLGPAPGSLPAFLEGIALDQVPLFWEPGDATLCERLIDAAHELGSAPSSLQGFVGREITFGGGADEVVAITQAASETNLRTIHVDMRRPHEAGATMVQELAFAVRATARCLEELTTQGLHAHEVARRLYYSVLVGTSYLPEVAKLRALRHLVAQLLEAFGVAPVPIFIHAADSIRSHSWIDPATNIIRSCSQAMSAVTGGCDAFSSRVKDDVLAVHIQLLLRHEAHLSAVSDPAAGAYYMEYLTDELARKSWQLAQSIEPGQSLLETPGHDTPGSTADSRRSTVLEEVATGQCRLVGVNTYPAPAGEAALPPAAPAADPRCRQPWRLAAPFEQLRRRVEALTETFGYRPVACAVRHDTASPALTALARRMFAAGGLAWAADQEDTADILVQYGDGHRQSGEGPGQATGSKVIVTVTDRRNGSPLNLFPGCNMVRVLNTVLEKLEELHSLRHAP